MALFGCLLLALPAASQEAAHPTAPVEMDGEVLFRVRGIEAFPAPERAKAIVSRVTELAADPSFRPEALRVENRGDISQIVGSKGVVMTLTNVEAGTEGIGHSLIAPAYADRIRRAIVEYREARTGRRLAAGAGRAVTAVVIAAGLLALVMWLLRRVESALQRAFDRRVGALDLESRRILRAERLSRALRSGISAARGATVLIASLFMLEYALAQFPWTRGTALHLFEYISVPLTAGAQGAVAAIPSLVLLAILFFIARYGLSLARLYFEAVQSGSIRLNDFEPEWAQPTYNLVRVAVIAATLTIAYPFIPGSNSEAFKGLSILAGLMLSLGSTSAIANVVAGYMIVFRRAFHVGDKVKIGDVVGFVTEMSLQVAHIHTAKNEEITIPNASILGSEVTNYSKPAREGKLILHSEVGIGYETPWRQVEALLIEAARRTPNVLTEPPPFVLPLKLGDFAITYEINAYTDRAEGMPLTYAALHRNILDLFNEHGVQIMTPAYEGDPEKPKIVEKDQWFATPAGSTGK